MKPNSPLATTATIITEIRWQLSNSSGRYALPHVGKHTHMYTHVVRLDEQLSQKEMEWRRRMMEGWKIAAGNQERVATTTTTGCVLNQQHGEGGENKWRRGRNWRTERWKNWEHIVKCKLLGIRMFWAWLLLRKNVCRDKKKVSDYAQDQFWEFTHLNDSW